MIVGVNHGLVAKLTTKNLNGTVGNDLVGVHIRLSAGACLPDDKREVVVEFAFNDLITGLNHGVGNLWLKSIVQVSLGGSLLKKTEGLDNRKGHALTLAANLEVLDGSLRLSAPVSISWHLNWTKSVRIFSELL